jgi:hypothetical protein
MGEPATSDPHLQGPEEERQQGQAASNESDETEFSTAQCVGCLVSLVLMVILLIVPKAIALWQDLHSDGTWVYPPIGVLVFWFLTVNTLFTGKIPYRSKDMDLREMPVVHYGAVVVFALAALGMYLLYVGLVFGW